jgi:flagellar hook-basal body complex protein FliE
MNLGSVNPIGSSPLMRVDGPLPKITLPSGPQTATPTEVLLGETDQLHQSVIAMQEAGVAFSMMVEVRNKLVESYQELMRMQV